MILSDEPRSISQRYLPIIWRERKYILLKMFGAETSESKTTHLKAEVLLSEPCTSDSGADNEQRLDRATSSYKDMSERFRLKERKFNRQYAQMYAVRLMAMKKKLAAAARRKWGE